MRTSLKVALTLLAGAIVVAIWPARLKRRNGQTKLDDIMPMWQFDEHHSIHVAAAPEKVFEAIRAVRAEDIRFFRTLTAIRRGFRSGGESILNPAPGAPILDVATRSGFQYLADDSPREIVIGMKLGAGTSATMNFMAIADGRGGSLVSTETRVYAKNKRGERRFAMYWRVIRLGSGLMRRMWLRAIRERAER